MRPGFCEWVGNQVWKAWWRNKWKDRLPCTNIAFDSSGTLYRMNDGSRTRYRVGDKRH